MSFPHEPGWRAGPHSATSQAAAESVREKAPAMLRVVSDILAEGPASPEQLHAVLAERGTPALLTSVRARVCQLHKQGRVVDSGQRGLGESRRAKVIVWRLSTADELSLFLARQAATSEHGENPHG